MARGFAYRRVVVVAALAALGAVLGPTACALFVPDEKVGSDCRFAGVGAPCGACVAAHCQASVNGCCADSTCAPGLAALERCTTSDPGGCADLAAYGGPLAHCVQSACDSTCSIAAALDAAAPDGSSPEDGAAAVDGASQKDGSDATGDAPAAASTKSCKLVAGTAKCTCDELGTPNSVQCTLDTFGDRAGTLCYQGNGTCECDHMGCHSTLANHCTCQLPDPDPSTSVCDETGLTCCVAGFGLCDCANLDCGGGIQVTTCSVSAMVPLLPGTYQLVDHCSDP